MKVRRAILVTLIGMLTTPDLRAQQDISPDLNTIVANATQWMTTPHADLPPLLPKSVAISLDRVRQHDLSDMAGRLSDARLLAASVYHATPQTLASDLSEQLRGISDIPAEIIKPMLIDPSRAKPIDAVAGAWCSDLLDLKPGDAVAAMVYWFADLKTHSLLNGAEPQRRLTMVLIKFTPTRDPAHPFAISRVAWGPIDQAGAERK